MSKKQASKIAEIITLNLGYFFIDIVGVFRLVKTTFNQIRWPWQRPAKALSHFAGRLSHMTMCTVWNKVTLGQKLKKQAKQLFLFYCSITLVENYGLQSKTFSFYSSFCPETFWILTLLLKRLSVPIGTYALSVHSGSVSDC